MTNATDMSGHFHFTFIFSELNIKASLNIVPYFFWHYQRSLEHERWSSLHDRKFSSPDARIFGHVQNNITPRIQGWVLSCLGALLACPKAELTRFKYTFFSLCVCRKNSFVGLQIATQIILWKAGVLIRSRLILFMLHTYANEFSSRDHLITCFKQIIVRSSFLISNFSMRVGFESFKIKLAADSPVTKAFVLYGIHFVKVVYLPL